MIYVSSREFRASKKRAAWTGITNCWNCSRVSDPPAWQTQYEDLDGQYVEMRLVGPQGDWGKIPNAYLKFMLVATPRGWRPAPWWGNRVCPSLTGGDDIIVSGSPRASCQDAMAMGMQATTPAFDSWLEGGLENDG